MTDDTFGLCACGEGPLTQAHLRVCRLRRDEKSELERAVVIVRTEINAAVACGCLENQMLHVRLGEVRTVLTALREAQAQNERFMAWARGKCECCGHEVVETECCQTVRYCGLSQEERNEHNGCNWTPPKEWEVKG